MSETRASSTEVDLDRIIEPLSREEFLATYWGKRSYHGRSSTPERFSSLLGMRDLDSLLTVTGFALLGAKNRPSLRVVRTANGKIEQRKVEGTFPNVYELYMAYDDGYTIVIDAVESRWTPMKAMCNALTAVLSHPIRANLYVTPEHSQGFKPHVDGHDVLILQLEGAKTWRLYPSGESLDEGSASLGVEGADGVRELLLEAGDLLYMPRGQRHDACTTDSFSVHVTVGVNTFTWQDFFTHLVDVVAADDELLLESLPVGFTHDEKELLEQARQVLERLDLDRYGPLAIDSFRTKMRSGHRPAPDGHFASLTRLGALSLDSRVSRRRVLAPYVTRVSDERASITFGGNSVIAPIGALDSLQYIADTGEFRVRDLPDSLTDDAKLVLVRRLVRAGLLALEPASDDVDFAQPEAPPEAEAEDGAARVRFDLSDDELEAFVTTGTGGGGH